MFDDDDKGDNQDVKSSVAPPPPASDQDALELAEMALKLQTECWSLVDSLSGSTDERPEYLPDYPEADAEPLEYYEYWNEAVALAKAEVRKHTKAASRKLLVAGDRRAKGKVCSRQSLTYV